MREVCPKNGRRGQMGNRIKGEAKTQDKAAPKKSPKRRGRPSLYLPEYSTIAFRSCLLGATDGDIAEMIGVDEATINRWKLEHKDFCESLKKGKRIADTTIANALYERAKGAEWIEETAIKCKDVSWDANGKRVETEHVEVVELRKAAPPDTTACIFWLKNREPKNWRDKQEVDASVHTDQPFTLIMGGPVPEAKR